MRVHPTGCKIAARSNMSRPIHAVLSSAVVATLLLALPWGGGVLAVRPSCRLDNHSAPLIYFLHIGKTAGKSARVDLLSTVRPIKSHECCWPKNTGGLDVVTFMRDPVAHVYSQWNHCRKNSDRWFNPEGLPESFEGWLEYWARAGDKPSNFTHGFGCYIPINFQARALSCKAWPYTACPKATASLDTDVKTKWEFGVDNETALRRVSDGSPSGAALIGLTEYYQESICLFHARYRKRLPTYCDCRDEEAWATFPGHHFTHGSEVAQDKVKLSARELELVHQLTDLDMLLYSVARTRFWAEVTRVEEQFGTQLSCKAERMVLFGDDKTAEARPIFYEDDDL